MKKSGVVFSLLAFLLLPIVASASSSISTSISSSISSSLSALEQLAPSTTDLSAMHMTISQTGGSIPTFAWDKTPWRVDQGGTGATSFTNGSVLFYSNGFAQDNANLSWDAGNHVLDIGMNASSTPLAKLNVKGNGTQGLLNLISSAGASQVFVASNGNVGLNTTSPRHRLDVAGAMYSRLVVASSGSIDWNAGNVQSLTLGAATTPISFANGQAGGEYTLIINQDATGGRTVSWPASIRWAGGGHAPTVTAAPGATDVIQFLYDGNNYLGSVTSNYSSNPTPVTPVNTSANVAVLVVGGGGGGASNGGGGGAGGYQSVPALTVSLQSYPVTVGAGGAGGFAGTAGITGLPSTFATITANGGGAGGADGPGGTVPGGDGGSGGGGGKASPGGLGNQGNGGGVGAQTGGGNAIPGGGGGAGGAGTAGTTNGNTVGNGGLGISNSISGSAVYYAGGGGAAYDSRISSMGGNGGLGGGGSGNTTSMGNGSDGVPNTGGGGGGGGGYADTGSGGAGGSGIVIISYPTGSLNATGGIITVANGNTIHTFTSSGVFTVTSIN